MGAAHYTRDELLTLAASQHAARLNNSTWVTLCQLGLSVRGPTPRGCRGGVPKPRQMKKIKDRGVNTRNLRSLRPATQDGTNVVLINARSVQNKATSISEYVTDTSTEILAITETWLPLRPHATVMHDLCPVGYKFLSVPRGKGKGGGVGLLYRSSLSIKQLKLQQTPTTFEVLSVTINRHSMMQMLVIYRPPPSQQNGFKFSSFLDEFHLLVTEALLLPGKIIILGDFNIHLDDPTDHDARLFLNMLDALNLTQHVTTATHQRGHILDLVISRNGDTTGVENTVTVDMGGLSHLLDHHPVACSVNLTIPKYKRDVRKCRKFRSVNCNEFASDVIAELSDGSCGPGGWFGTYDTVLRKVADKHAPEASHVIRERPYKLWYNDNIHAQRIIRRKLERRWLHTNLVIDKDIYQQQCRAVVNMIKQAKSEYYKEKLGSATAKDMFKVLQSLTNVQERILPTYSSEKSLANQFVQFFLEKVAKVRSTLDASDVVATPECTVNVAPAFSTFSGVSDATLLTMMKRSPSKSCSLDPVPTWLIKNPSVLEGVLPTLTIAINSSFKSGVVPDSQKNAFVTSPDQEDWS